MKTFVSSKNWISVSILWTLVLFLIWTVLVPKNAPDSSIYIFNAIILSIIVCLIWVLCDTKYVIKDKLLHYYSGPFRGIIEIDKINKMKRHSGWVVPVLMKPGLGTRGYIISYNKFDDIYFSPKDLEEFSAVLQRINPAIQITS